MMGGMWKEGGTPLSICDLNNLVTETQGSRPKTLVKKQFEIFYVWSPNLKLYEIYACIQR